jgi:hypothetical protein
MASSSRDSAAGSPKAVSPEERANEALTLMVEALGLIDLSDGANVAGAHLDLAIHRLREWIETTETK